jgi:hypothetical protein
MQEIVHAANKSWQDMVAALKQRAGQVNTAFAEEARQIARQALQDGRHSDAIAFAGISAMAYQAMGNVKEHLRARFEMHQADYAQSESEAEYLRVGAALNGLTAECEDLGQDDIALQSKLLDINCQLFAARVAGNHQHIAARVLGALERLHEVMQRGGKALAKNEGFDFFVYVLVEGVSTASEGVWIDADAVARDALLEDLAKDVETIVPVDFVTGDPQGTVMTARVLGNLSRRHGTPAAANARLAAAAATLK